MARLAIVDPHDSKHFRDRMLQRFGILLTASDLWDLRRSLRASVLIETDEDGCQHRVMKLSGKLLRVVYNPKRDYFVTAIPLTEKEKMTLA